MNRRRVGAFVPRRQPTAPVKRYEIGRSSVLTCINRAKFTGR